MAEEGKHIWKPIEAARDGWDIECTYQNELGEEHIHMADGWNTVYNPRDSCWSECVGDYPGCKWNCPLFCDAAAELRNEAKEYEREQQELISHPDPFNFMLNHVGRINEFNYYTEEFDTLDGTHWEISLDVAQQVMDMFDEETKEDL